MGMRTVCNSDGYLVPSRVPGYCSLSNLGVTQLCMTFDCCFPHHSVLGKGFPFSYTHLAGPEVPFHYIIELEFWASDGSTIRHALHVSEPAEPSLPKENLH